MLQYSRKIKNGELSTKTAIIPQARGYIAIRHEWQGHIQFSVEKRKKYLKVHRRNTGLFYSAKFHKFPLNANNATVIDNLIKKLFAAKQNWLRFFFVTINRYMAFYQCRAPPFGFEANKEFQNWRIKNDY